MSGYRHDGKFSRVANWLVDRCGDCLVLFWRGMTLPLLLYRRRKTVEQWQAWTRNRIAEVHGEVTFYGDTAVTMEPDAVAPGRLVISYIMCDRHGATRVLASQVEKYPAEAFATLRLWNEFYSIERFRPKWWKPIPSNVRKPE